MKLKNLLERADEGAMFVIVRKREGAVVRSARNLLTDKAYAVLVKEKVGYIKMAISTDGEMPYLIIYLAE